MLPGELAVSRLGADEPAPVWAARGAFSSVTRTAHELSVVCAAEAVPAGVQAERGWRCLRVVGRLDFSLTGTDADFTSKLEALERQDRAKIISNPRITTADNKEAKIVVGKKIPLVVSDESGNAITELTTIGIKLVVVPHINQDNRITLDLAPEVSDLSAQATVQGGLVIVTAEAATRVIVQDGQTAVIGGLIRTNESRVERGIPYLMDVPLLGHLFKTSNNVQEQRELLIFVTPRIIRPEET